MYDNKRNGVKLVATLLSLPGLFYVLVFISYYIIDVDLFGVLSGGLSGLAVLSWLLLLGIGHFISLGILLIVLKSSQQSEALFAKKLKLLNYIVSVVILLPIAYFFFIHPTLKNLF